MLVGDAGGPAAVGRLGRPHRAGTSRSTARWFRGAGHALVGQPPRRASTARRCSPCSAARARSPQQPWFARDAVRTAATWAGAADAAADDALAPLGRAAATATTLEALAAGPDRDPAAGRSTSGWPTPRRAADADPAARCATPPSTPATAIADAARAILDEAERAAGLAPARRPAATLDRAAPRPAPLPAPAPPRADRGPRRARGGRATAEARPRLTGAYFEALLPRRPRPVGHATDPYERAKYDATLAALRRAARSRAACELGCSIGVLAARAGAALRRAARARRRADRRRRGPRAAGAARRTSRSRRRRCPRSCPAGRSTSSSPARSSTTSTRDRCSTRAARLAGGALAPGRRAARRPLGPATRDRTRCAATRSTRSSRATPGLRADRAERARALPPRRPGARGVSASICSSAAGRPGSPAARAYRDAGGDGAVVLARRRGRTALPAPAAVQGAAARRGASPTSCRSRTTAGTPSTTSTCAAARAPRARSRRRAASRSRAATSWPTTRCVLATGARPSAPAGARRRRPRRRTCCARSTTRWRCARWRSPRTRVVVVGSGFIGCEAAASLRARGRRVTLVEPGGRAAGGAARRRGRPRGSRAGCARRASTLRSAPSSRGIDAATCASRWPTAARSTADVVAARRRRAPATRRWPRDAGLALADGGEVAADARDAHLRPARAGRGDVRRAEHAVAGRRAARRALGRRAGPGRGRRARRRRAATRPGTAPGLLVDDRRAHAEVRGLGRRLRRGRVEPTSDGAFTRVRYRRDGRTVGVLAHERDDDYEARPAHAGGGGAVTRARPPP